MTTLEDNKNIIASDDVEEAEIDLQRYLELNPSAWVNWLNTFMVCFFLVMVFESGLLVAQNKITISFSPITASFFLQLSEN